VGRSAVISVTGGGIRKIDDDDVRRQAVHCTLLQLLASTDNTVLHAL
jgi:hypothetical protein